MSSDLARRSATAKPQSLLLSAGLWAKGLRASCAFLITAMRGVVGESMAMRCIEHRLHLPLIRVRLLPLRPGPFVVAVELSFRTASRRARISAYRKHNDFSIGSRAMLFDTLMRCKSKSPATFERSDFRSPGADL